MPQAVARALAGILFVAIFRIAGSASVSAADSRDDPGVFAADHTLAAALANADKSAAAKLFDADFLWTSRIQPKDDAEKGIRASWAGLELALTNRIDNST